jgi:hypothetical protein
MDKILELHCPFKVVLKKYNIRCGQKVLAVFLKIINNLFNKDIDNEY